MSEAPTGEPAAAPSIASCRLALVGAGLLWSVGGLFIKLLTSHPSWQVSALAITFYRSLFAALTLLPLVRGRRFPAARDTAVAVVLYLLLLGLYVASAQGTSAANAILLQYTAPLYALVLGCRFMGEPFQREDAIAIAVAVLGVGVLLVGNFTPGQEIPLAMGAASGLMFGLFLLALRKTRGCDPVAVTVANNAGVALCAGVILAVVSPRELAVPLRIAGGEHHLLAPLGLLAAMGAVQIGAPYVLLSMGLRRVPAAEAGLIALVEPLLTPLWVVLVVGERPTAATLLGGAVLLSALAVRYGLLRPRLTARITGSGGR